MPWPRHLRFARLSSFALVFTSAALLLMLAPSAGRTQEGEAPNSSVRPQAGAVSPGGPKAITPEPAGSSDAEGGTQHVFIAGKKVGRLELSNGAAWRYVRTGSLAKYGAWAIGGMVGLLVVFYGLRGRIVIEHGWTGRTLKRFSEWERFSHWLLALSFLTLALTGLNALYGPYVLLPLLGPETFTWLSRGGKWLHNHVAFAFMIALLLTAINWIPKNLASWRDIVWLAKGGEMFFKGSHPPAWKFNAGQKLLFWIVMLSGLSLSLSGIALLLPFQIALFANTFALLNTLGPHLPTELTPLQEIELAASSHGILALVLIVIIIAHIYIRTLGMQGAFSAMGTGHVDVNWAKEHHSLWTEQELKRMESVAAAETDAARLAAAQ
jgi:formate dehydrogenase subunit gamma